MIEIPRACWVADEIAKHAEFFSFGTNDLTQMTFGYSRDDAEGGFLLKYVEDKILPDNPFQTLDDVIAAEMQMAVDKGRSTRPDLKIGICGEHGGDPASIAQVRADRPQLRLLLAVPRAGRPARRRPGSPRRRRRARQVVPGRRAGAGLAAARAALAGAAERDTWRRAGSGRRPAPGLG